MTSFLISIINFAVNFINSHIPSYDFESSTYNNVSDGITSVVHFLTDVNFIVPLADVAVIMSLTIGIRLFKFTLFAGNWLVRRVCDLLP